MKITNVHGLPQPIVNALENPTYTKGDAMYSVTELLSPPQMVQLKRLHADKLEMDASDMFWALLGTAVHNILEKHADEEQHISEERIFAELDGVTISGAIDLQILRVVGRKIQDYKTTGAWAVMNEKIDWERQLNCYAWLVEVAKNDPVTALEIVAIIRDWSRRDAENKAGYPEAPVKVIPIRLWAFFEREQYLRERVRLHQEAYAAAEMGDPLPECTGEEMWEKESRFAIMKPNAKRATKLCDSREEAETEIASLVAAKPKDKYEITLRPGERTRCENYCSARDFCSQWAKYQEER